MEIRELINLESGMYTATMGDEEVIIFREKGYGFSIMHEPNENGWCDVTYYDEEGNFEGQGVER